MRSVRIIPRLDVKGDRLVKGVHLEGVRPLGPVHEFAKRYYDDGADELLYLDAVASLYGRNSMLDVVERAARDVFVPITVGGGIRSCDDIQAALRAGADKVAINTAALQRPEFVREAAERFGSSTIVVSIDAKWRGCWWEALTDTGREKTGQDAVAWAKRAVELGAGELLVTSVDTEGTRMGFDAGLYAEIAPHVSVPVIACGGAWDAQDVAEAIQDGRADAVCMASMFHYGQETIMGLKEELRERGIACRRVA